MLQNWIIACWLALLAVGSAPSFAAPPPCAPVKIKVVNHTVVLEGLSAAMPAGQLFYIKNMSDKSLWLDHPGKQGSASAGWSSYLRPHNWSALFLNKKDFTLTCSAINPGNVDELDCGKVLAVCVPPHATLNKNRKGSYWLLEDKPWDTFITLLSKHGLK